MEYGLSFDCENRPASTGGRKELFERERNGDPDFRVVLTAFAYFVALPAEAQLGPVNGVTSTPVPGAGHDYIGDLVDTISPADGSVSIRIKAPVPSGRGIKLPFSFNYDSAGVVQPTVLPNDSGGVSLSMAKPVRYLSAGGWTYGVPRLDATDILYSAQPKGFCARSQKDDWRTCG
jgi:hypothetical protein